MKNLKIVTIISFLIIVFPDKIAFINLIILPLSIVNYIMELFYSHQSYFYIFYNLLISIITLSSVICFFQKNKYIVMSSIIIQILFLAYMFKLKFLNYWYFTIPTAVYLILSLILIYSLFFKSKKRIK